MRRNALAAAVVLLVLRCDTRIPEEPSDESNYKDFDRIENLISNLHQAIGRLDNVGYIACFNESLFVYRADYNDSLDYPARLADWDYGKEMAFMRNLNSRYSDGERNLDQTDFDTDGTVDEQDTLIENVLLKIPQFAASLGDSLLPAEIRVFVDLVVKKDADNLYTIHRWTEERATGIADSIGSWASIKAEMLY